MSALDRAGVLVARHFPAHPPAGEASRAPGARAGRGAAGAQRFQGPENFRAPLVDPVHNAYDVSALLEALAAGAKVVQSWCQRRPKLVFSVVGFLATWAVTIKLGFGSVFFSVAGIIFIFMNLGERQDGRLSSYSIFNEGLVSLPGTTTAADVDAQLRHRSTAPDTTARAIGAGSQLQQQRPQRGSGNNRADLRSETPRGRLARLSGQPCPCGSGIRYKRCCHARELAEWDEARQLEARRVAAGLAPRSMGRPSGRESGSDSESVEAMGYGADLTDSDAD